MIVPARFAADLVAAEGEPARAWLARLPELVRRCLRRWRLTVDGEVMHGFASLVLPVLRADRAGTGGTAAVLKVGWPHPESEHEALALRTWDGRGAVRLLDSDGNGALLLERLDATAPLHSVEPAAALEVLAGLLRRLSVPAPPGLRSMAAIAARWRSELPAESARLGDPVPPRLLAAALDACSALGPTAGEVMVNEDLHYGNVLRGVREPWLVIDPKVLAGDPEYGVIPMLWNRFAETGGARGLDARFDAVVRLAGLDAGRARGWTLARAVDNWLWSLEHGGFPAADTCAAIAEWAAVG